MKDKTDNTTIEKKELPNLPLRMIINGSSGCGKSSLLGWLLCQEKELGYKNDFKPENIYIFSGSLKMEDGEPKGDYKLSKMIEYLKIPEENIFDNFDNDIMNELYDNLVDEFNESIDEKEKPEHKLIIMDDLGYQNKTNKSRVEDSSIDKLFCNGRKYLISTIILNQRIIQANRTCLANASAVVLYKPNNQDLEVYESNFNYLKDKKQFKNMVREHTKTKHNFLCIDFTKDDIYRNDEFQPILICKCGKGKNDCGLEKYD